VGLPGFETRLALYLRKTGQLPDDEAETADQESLSRMRWGLRHEPTIAQAYLDERGGTFVAEQLYCVSQTHPFMCATLDRVHQSGKIVEIKSTGERNAERWGEPGTDEIPHVYLVQVLHQIHVSGIDEADVAVLIGASDFRIYHVGRAGNERTIECIVDLEAEFMEHVRRRDPPAVDPRNDSNLMAYLYPEETGTVTLTEEQTAAWQDYERYGASIKELEGRRAAAKLVVAQAMANAASGLLADGRTLTRKVVEVKESCVVRKAHRYPLFRIARAQKTFGV